MSCQHFVAKGKQLPGNMECFNPVVSLVFTKLSTHTPVIGIEEQSIIVQFVITMYDRSSEATNLDFVRLDLFARKQRSDNT